MSSTKLDRSLDDIISADKRGAGGAARRSNPRNARSSARGTTRSSPYTTDGEGEGASGRKNVRAPKPPSMGGFKHLQGSTLDDIARAPPSHRVLKVGQGSQAKKVAGSICYITRAGSPPALLPLGASAVNQATKAVAIARGYLAEENVFLYCQPEYRDAKQSSVTMHLVEASKLRSGGGREMQLTVGKNTAPGTLAGAIAGKVRDNEKHCLTGIGSDSVAQMIYAVALAREYLVEEKIDIYCIPAFIHVMKEDEEKTAVKLKINWAPYDADTAPTAQRQAPEKGYAGSKREEVYEEEDEYEEDEEDEAEYMDDEPAPAPRMPQRRPANYRR